MRDFKIMTACAAALMLGGVAVAKEKPANGERKICRVEMPAVGRIPAKKACRTQAEWDRLAMENERDATRILRDASSRK